MNKIDWDYERGVREGYVNKEVRFVVIYIEEDEGLDGKWVAKDLETGKKNIGTYESMMKWCEEQHDEKHNL